MNSQLFLLLALISVAVASPGYGPPPPPPCPKKPEGPCAGKKVGFQFCQGGGLATCKENGVITATDCGLARSASGKDIIGRCEANADGSGKCVQPKPCEYEDVGFQYCNQEGGQSIATCRGKNQVTAVDCGLARNQFGSIIGKCYTVDGKARCEQVPQGGPCKDKRPGTYCSGGSGLLKCPEGKVTDCPIARMGYQQFGGKCIPGKTDKDALCEPIPQNGGGSPSPPSGKSPSTPSSGYGYH